MNRKKFSTGYGIVKVSKTIQSKDCFKTEIEVTIAADKLHPEVRVKVMKKQFDVSYSKREEQDKAFKRCDQQWAETYAREVYDALPAPFKAARDMYSLE